MKDPLTTEKVLCREVTHFGKWGRSNSRCHEPKTHEVVSANGIHYQGCEKHANRIAGRFASPVTVRRIA